MRTSKPIQLAATIALVLISTMAGTVLARPAAQNQPAVEVQAAVHHDVSGPLRGAPSAPSAHKLTEKPLRVLPNKGNALNQPDGAIQAAPGPQVGTTTGLSFAGVGQGDYGFSDQYAPPDTNGAVGATQYVQWVNAELAVFNKTTGAIVPGFPKAGNPVWAGFGGGCETNNDGDPLVRDPQPQRYATSLSAGNLLARLELALDGQHRHG